MTTQPISSHLTTPGSAGTLLQRAWRFNRPLALAIFFHLALTPLLLIALFVDPRMISGVNGWIKPLKFAVSGAIYGATFLWLLTFVRGRVRLVQTIATITGVALLVETTLITMQVLRHTASHFNVATPFDSAVFSMMGIFIMALAMANFALAIALGFQRLPDPVVAWGIRWGLIISLAGMASGVLMTTANLPPATLAAVQAGQPVTIAGAHSVGVDDGGPGLPFLGWSTTGGDLRVGHFVGLHGLQVLPFLAFLLTRAWVTRRLSTRRRVALIWTAGIGYFALTCLLTWQALRAQPLIAPDSMTLLAGTLLLVAVVGAALVIIVSPDRHITPQPA
ncbi:MAG TPA: hypothetical protein DCL15_11805 [Chloroflexi bacterium]|nr:hypothetical protein [Chloroflexota bacterium]HHW87589.1 hypothetical protein [Chloroflexota bacterium]